MIKINIRQYFCLLVVTIILVFGIVHDANAWVKVNIKNNRSYSIFVAFCWQNFDTEDDKSKGWFKVEAGKSTTVTIKSAIWQLTQDGFGYYATETSNGKTRYWRGKGGDEQMEYYIHPKKTFTGSHNEPIDGGKLVSFRKMKMREAGTNADGSINGIANLTFNP
jgi:uncharacterized membrane protein